jgi:hypothetical protein
MTFAFTMEKRDRTAYALRTHRDAERRKLCPLPVGYVMAQQMPHVVFVDALSAGITLPKCPSS